MQRPCSHSTARGEAHGVSWVARVKAKHCSHRTVVRYSSKDGQKVEERLTLSRAVKQMQLEREEGNLQGLSLRDLRQRLDLLGENTLGINSPQELRKLLALRLLSQKSKAARFPLRRSSTRHRGKSYITLPVDVENLGFTDFLVDTGTTGTLITSTMRDELGLSPLAGKAAKGLDSLGVTLRQKVALPELRLGPFKLHSPDGFVIDYRTSEGENVGGVLGVNFLSSFDIEINPEDTGYIAFHPLGHVKTGVIDTEDCSPLTCNTTKGGLLSVRVSLNGSKPFPGIIDLGANVSTMNTAAARMAEATGVNLNVDKVTTTDGSTTLVLKSGVSVCLGDPACGESYVPPNTLSPLIIRDVPIFGLLGWQEHPAMILGRDIIGRERTILQLGSQRIWLHQRRADQASP